MMPFSPKKLFHRSKQDRLNKAETGAAASSPPGAIVSSAPAKHLACCLSRVKSINTNTKPVSDVEGAAASPGAIMSSPDKAAVALDSSRVHNQATHLGGC